MCTPHHQHLQLWLRTLPLVLIVGLLLAEPTKADIVIYAFSGSVSSNLEASPFADGEQFAGSISLDLDAPQSSTFEGVATYENAIIDFNIQFAGGLQLDGITGGSVTLNTRLGHLVSFFPIEEATAFSNSTVNLDSLTLRFIDNTSSSLTSLELTALPLNFDGFSLFRDLQVEDLDSQGNLQYRSNGGIQQFSGTAVPEPNISLLLSVAALQLILRRKRQVSH